MYMHMNIDEDCLLIYNFFGHWNYSSTACVLKTMEYNYNSISNEHNHIYFKSIVGVGFCVLLNLYYKSA